MGRSVIGLCAVVGLTVGSYVPVLWGRFGLLVLVDPVRRGRRDRRWWGHAVGGHSETRR